VTFMLLVLLAGLVVLRREMGEVHPVLSDTSTSAVAAPHTMRPSFRSVSPPAILWAAKRA
jgi:hypothetical protein